MFEYEQAYPSSSPAGLLLSDDTHMNAAWDDFCVGHGLEPTRVEDLGVTRKPRDARASSASGKTIRIDTAGENHEEAPESSIKGIPSRFI